MDVVVHNRSSWNAAAKQGNPWSISMSFNPNPEASNWFRRVDKCEPFGTLSVADLCQQGLLRVDPLGG